MQSLEIWSLGKRMFCPPYVQKTLGYVKCVHEPALQLVIGWSHVKCDEFLLGQFLYLRLLTKKFIRVFETTALKRPVTYKVTTRLLSNSTNFWRRGAAYWRSLSLGDKALKTYRRFPDRKSNQKKKHFKRTINISFGSVKLKIPARKLRKLIHWRNLCPYWSIARQRVSLECLSF